MEQRAPPRTAWTALALIGVLAVAAWTRLRGLAHVTAAASGIRPQGGDSAYHLRRMELAAEAFPGVPVHDPLMNWPHGGPCHWAPGFDWMGALALRVLGEGPPAAPTLALLPVALGLVLVGACVTAARGLAARDAAAPAGLLAGLVLAVLPQAVSMSGAGRVDHHVAEALGMAALGGWALLGTDPRPWSPRRRWAYELLGAAAALFACWTFAGSVLYVAVAAAAVLTTALLRSERAGELPGAGAVGLLASAPLLALLYRSSIAEHGLRLSYVFPSLLQPALLAVAGLGVAAAVWAARGGPLPSRLKRLALLGGGSLLVALVALPAARAELAAGLAGWLGRRDPWLASITEFQPLIASDVGLERVREFLGLPGLLAPVLVPLGLLAAFRADRRRGWVWAGWTLALLVLTLWQSRFGRVFAFNLAACAGLAPSLLAGRARHAAGAALVALLLLGGETRGTLVPKPAGPPDALEAAAVFLRAAADGEPRPGRGDGVLAPWDYGHFVLWHAARPVVATGFGSYLDPEGYREVRTPLLGDEDSLRSLLDRRDLGWVVAGAATLHRRVEGPSGEALFTRDAAGRGGLDPAFLAARPLGTLAVGGSGAPGLVPHLETLRPVWAAPGRVVGVEMPLPVLWVYRRVAGARIEGSAPPGTPVLFRVELLAPTGPLPWVAAAEAGEDGVFRLRVPVPTSTRVPQGLETGPGALRVGERILPIELSEAAVLAGERVRVEPADQRAADR